MFTAPYFVRSSFYHEDNFHIIHAQEYVSSIHPKILNFMLENSNDIKGKRIDKNQKYNNIHHIKPCRIQIPSTIANFKKPSHQNVTNPTHRRDPNLSLPNNPKMCKNVQNQKISKPSSK